MTEYDSGPIEPVNLFGRTGGERFEEMFCNPSSSHPQADSSGAKASSQSVDPPAAEAEGIAVSQDESHPAFSEAEPVSEPVVEPVVEAAPAVEANAEDALSEAAPEESRRPTGPRGPNMHTSPTTLAELAPQGCSITLNSNLALGFGPLDCHLCSITVCF